MGNAQPLITCALTPLAHATHVPTITGANFQHNRGTLPGLSGPGDEERDTINEKKLGLPDASPCSANDAENARLETPGQAFSLAQYLGNRKVEGLKVRLRFSSPFNNAKG